jgi:hypothetical protein
VNGRQITVLDQACALCAQLVTAPIASRQNGSHCCCLSQSVKNKRLHKREKATLVIGMWKSLTGSESEEWKEVPRFEMT